MKKNCKIECEVTLPSYKTHAELVYCKLIAINQISWQYIIKQTTELWQLAACFENTGLSVLSCIGTWYIKS